MFHKAVQQHMQEVTEKHKKKHLLQTMLYESNWLYLLTKNIIDPSANIP